MSTILGRIAVFLGLIFGILPLPRTDKMGKLPFPRTHNLGCLSPLKSKIFLCIESGVRWTVMTGCPFASLTVIASICIFVGTNRIT